MPVAAGPVAPQRRPDALNSKGAIVGAFPVCSHQGRAVKRRRSTTGVRPTRNRLPTRSTPWWTSTRWLGVDRVRAAYRPYLSSTRRGGWLVWAPY